MSSRKYDAKAETSRLRSYYGQNSTAELLLLSKNLAVSRKAIYGRDGLRENNAQAADIASLKMAPGKAIRASIQSNEAMIYGWFKTTVLFAEFLTCEF